MLARSANYQSRITATYRKVKQTAISAIADSTPQNGTFLAQTDQTVRAFNNAISGTVFYALGGGQELQRIYSYVPVPAGTGNYTWRDYNADGIAQLNEFEIALFADQGKYIRVLLPTTTYVRTTSMQFNASLSLTPPSAWAGQGRIQKFATKFSTLTAFSTDKKSQNTNLALNANPFAGVANDDHLISLNAVVRNILYFNRANPSYGADLSNQVNQKRLFLTNGFETRTGNVSTLKGRYSLSRTFGAEATLAAGRRAIDAPAISNRTYAYRLWDVQPQLSYTPTTTFRLIASLALSDRRTANAEQTRLAATRYQLEARWNLPKQGNLFGTVSLIKNRFNGLAGSPLGYELLQGLQAGSNALWSAGIARQIGAATQVTVSYEGRKSGDAPVVHTARVQARLLF